MTNREKYAQEIIDIFLTGLPAVDAESGKPMQCGFGCEKCAFKNKKKALRLECDPLFEKWLNAECKEDKAEEKAVISHAINYLNAKTDRHYRVANKATERCIKARLKEGYTQADFEKVIDIKVAEWSGTEYEKYLAPETLFGNKFDKYLNQPERKREDKKRSSKWGD